MGNCVNKPATTEGEAPVTEEKAVESTEREIVSETKVNTTDGDQTNPRSLAQMSEDEEKKPDVVEVVAPPAEETPGKAETSEPRVEETKPAEVAAATVEAPAKVEDKK